MSCSDLLICNILHLFSGMYDYIMVFSSMWWNDGRLFDEFHQAKKALPLTDGEWHMKDDSLRKTKMEMQNPHVFCLFCWNLLV